MSYRRKLDQPHENAYADFYEEPYEPGIGSYNNQRHSVNMNQYMTVTHTSRGGRGRSQPVNFGSRNRAEQLPTTVTDFSVEPFEMDQMYPQELIKSGTVVSNELQHSDNIAYFVLAENYEGKSTTFYVPKSISREPRGLKHSDINKWRKRFAPEFGENIAFVCQEGREPYIRNYRKLERPVDNTEVVNSINCIKVKCVLDRQNGIARTDDFGNIDYSPVQISADEHVVYDAYVGFAVIDTAEKSKVVMKINKIIGVCDSQAFAIQGGHLFNDETDVQPADQPDVVGAVQAFRVNKRECILVKNPDYSKPMRIPFAFDSLPLSPVGTHCQIDYIKYAVPNDQYEYIVMSVRPITHHQVDGDCFWIELAADRQWKGFYYHKDLGVIADSTGMLGFVPYRASHPADGLEFDSSIKSPAMVKIKWTPNQMCSFDIVELSKETAELVKDVAFKELKATGLLVNAETGKLVSNQYPGLQLRLHKNIRSQFRIGDMIETYFNPDATGQMFFSTSDVKRTRIISSDKTRECIQFRPDFAILNLHVQKIRVTGRLSKKEQKKRGIEQEEPLYQDFEGHFQGYLCRGEMIIDNSKNKVKGDGENVTAHVVVETMGTDDRSQAALRFLYVFDHRLHHFTDTDPAISVHVKRRLKTVPVQSFVNLDEDAAVESEEEKYSTPRQSPIPVRVAPPPVAVLTPSAPPGFSNKPYTLQPAAYARPGSRNNVPSPNGDSRTGTPNSNETLVRRLENLQVHEENEDPVDKFIKEAFNKIGKKYGL